MTDKITQEELLRLLQEGMGSGDYDPNLIFSEVRKVRAEIRRRKEKVEEFTWRTDWKYRYLTHDLLGNSSAAIPFVRGRKRKPDEKWVTYAEATAAVRQYVLDAIDFQQKCIARREEVLQNYAEMVGEDVDERRTLVDVLSRYAEALHDSPQQVEEVTEQVKAALKDVERFFETCCVDKVDEEEEEEEEEE